MEARIETLVRREALARGLPRFMPRHLSQLLWANALADKSANDLLMAVRHELLVERNASLTDFSAAGLVHVAWAFARMLGQPSQLGADLALLIGEELEARSFDTLPPRYVSTLLWSMARLGADSPRVLGSAHKWLAESDLAMLSAQSLVMSVWAMSTLSQVSEESLARVEQEMLRRGLEEFQPQELNAAVFAFSKARTPNDGSGRWEGPIWDAVDAEASRRSSASRVRQTASVTAAASRPQRTLDVLRDDSDRWGGEGEDEAEDEVANWAASLASNQRQDMLDA